MEGMRAVCRISVNNTKWCTGVLLNTPDLTPEPYILTVAHCIGSQNEASKSIFYFNYESPECDGPDGSINHSISGSQLIATGDTLGDNLNRDSLDFSLVKLTVTPPDSFSVFLAGWNRDTTAASQTASIHHPHGDVKKISFDYDKPVTSYHTPNYYPDYVDFSHWRIIQWDLATTEMGSSGAPLFDQNKRVVGILTGGEARCVSSVDDYYTKIDYAWDYYTSPLKHLKTWLDPTNSGVIAIDGRDFINSAEDYQQEQVQIYPNPGSGRYLINPGQPFQGTILINVFSLAGEIIFTDKILHPGLYELNLNNHTPGLYIVRLIFPDRIYTAKIILQP
ncbi:MAG: hypothetical protein AMS27_04690 [Bacteroides sp. SM23_62_1]|nr:MAG: hypothetical protein AMS27_04690 [Bacteroides sp. SM23_62_1]